MSSVSCFLKRENEKECLGMKMMMSQEAVEVIVVQTVILDLLAQG